MRFCSDATAKKVFRTEEKSYRKKTRFSLVPDNTILKKQQTHCAGPQIPVIRYGALWLQAVERSRKFKTNNSSAAPSAWACPVTKNEALWLGSRRLFWRRKRNGWSRMTLNNFFPLLNKEHCFWVEKHKRSLHRWEIFTLPRKKTSRSR